MKRFNDSLLVIVSSIVISLIIAGPGLFLFYFLHSNNPKGALASSALLDEFLNALPILILCFFILGMVRWVKYSQTGILQKPPLFKTLCFAMAPVLTGSALITVSFLYSNAPESYSSQGEFTNILIGLVLFIVTAELLQWIKHIKAEENKQSTMHTDD